MQAMESEQMLLWPALALIGFLVLMALVVALGTVSTDRYEREQRAGVHDVSAGCRPAATTLGERLVVPGDPRTPVVGEDERALDELRVLCQ